MKKLIINGLPYKQNSSGIGVMIRELFGTLTQETDQETLVILPHDGPEFPTSRHSQIMRIPWKHHQHFQRIFFQTFSMGKYCSDDTICLTTDSKAPLFLSKHCLLIPLITDLAVFRMPQVYQISRVLLWRLQYIYLSRRANHFFAVSQFTKMEMMNLLKIPDEKIHVIPCAASDYFSPVTEDRILADLHRTYQLPESYLLFVGNHNPRKNLERLLLAFDQAKKANYFPHHLVIAGEQGWKFDREKSVSHLEYAQEIHFIGFVPDEAMPALYSAADLFLFPTLYEGFGIPVLEAQSCGTPVLTSRCSSLPEVGGTGAFYVDPYDVGSIADGISQLLFDSDLCHQLVQQGFENIKRFSWSKSAQLLHQLIEDVQYENF